MNTEDKDLLLKDLCARLPYGVKGLVTFNRNLSITQNQVETRTINSKLYDRFARFQDSWYDNVTIKPYLFPLSSMTEEQRNFLHKNPYGIYVQLFDNTLISASTEGFDWLNKNHFDYRGLIEKGLALDATGLGIY